MSKDRAVRSSQNFKPTNRSKSKTSFKSKEKPKFRSGTKPKNRSRDSGKAETIRSRSGSRPSYRPPKGASKRYTDRDRRQPDRRQSDRRHSDRGPKELFPATCAKCKKETQVPFKPTGTKPVLCRDCFQDQKPRDGSARVRRSPSSSGGRSNYRSSNRYDDRSRRQSDRGPKELFPATCAKCKKETQVPFKPTGTKPVLCRDCFQDQKPRDGSRQDRRSSSSSRGRSDYRSSDRSSSKYGSRNRRQSERRGPELHNATCAKCNKETKVPFKPSGDKPVYCRDCFQDQMSDVESKHNENNIPQEGEVVERFGEREGPYRTNKRMHQTTCRTCKKEITIPFKPKTNKPIYCQDCFKEVFKEQ